MYETVKKEMTQYYRKTDLIKGMELRDKDASERINGKFEQIYNDMDAFYKENPFLSSALLKSKIHGLMAEYCEPVIFFENPFFFEIEYKHSRSRGLRKSTPSYWLQEKKKAELLKKYPAYAEAEERYNIYYDANTYNLCSINSSFDLDHCTLGYTKLFKVGVGGLIKEAEEKRNTVEEGSEAFDYCTAIIESLNAVILIAHKFADKAEFLLQECETENQTENLKLIAKAARKIPEYAPETFYEGLAMLIFMREVVFTLENMGISHIGHVDRLLGKLYQQDLASGRITEDEARRLISIWMMHTDIKFDIENNSWPETSLCIQLGGVDEDGNTIFNDVTKMFIQEHHRLGLISPKLNCRYSEKSPDEYLELIGKALLAGHNNFALMNDDVVIDGLLKSGVERQDAVMYVNGGCQETMIEGFGHTEGTATYISLLRCFDLFLRQDSVGDIIPPIGKADTFEEFYEKFLSSFRSFYNNLIQLRNYRQSYFKQAISFPIYSATQDGCIKNCKDFIEGGAKYNFSTIAIVGFANVVDSLYSIKQLVYEQKRLSLKDFINILALNWDGNEVFRQEVINLPKFGHNDKEVDAMANCFLKDVSDIIKQMKNERGGSYITSTFVYHHNRIFSQLLRATPDGRRDYDYLAASCSPSVLKEIKDITKPIKSMHNIDLTVCGGGVSVLDMMLPATKNFDEKVFRAFIKSCGKNRCFTLQPNVVSVDELLDAKKHPEKHKNLIIRICGLSVCFVALSPEVQDEVINRNMYEYGSTGNE